MIDFERYFPVNEDSLEEFEKYAVYLKSELEKVYQEKWQITYRGKSAYIKSKSEKDKNVEFEIGALFQHYQTGTDRHIEINKAVSVGWHNKKELSGGGGWREFCDMNEWCEKKLTKKKQEQLSLW